ncbi:hypothetical protein phiAS5_ORF0004 [Aeromonas phage phiAS5]|uniref:Uncharacterized protein n=1 Tax=Aeromonas phage phiAS5 TaxID=879630 RepID=E1A2A1_9CAUD|nr:hypothetical protein phiAS5_ORF0004 [Aeromonas phage phiAS5]ADM79847.1 hypothetical protein phiAS5_ORF0004 [Aeromonas phage phiAS5]BES53047.1 hypothetical protein [Aeromonas phage phiWae14]
MFIKINNKQVPCEFRLKVDGSYKIGTPYIKVNGKYQPVNSQTTNLKLKG